MEIELSRSTDDFEQCAEMMARSEPWITLKFDAGRCRQAFEGEHKEVYITREGNKIIGFAILFLYGLLKGYIQVVCVHPDFRGKGIGTALLKFSEARIFKIAPNVFICVSSFNPGAQKLYKGLGYEKIAELRDFLVRGQDEWLLRKTIGPASEFKPLE